MTKKYSHMAITKGRLSNDTFARLLSETSDGAYSILECKDFLDIFAAAMYRAVVEEQKHVRIIGFGTIYPYMVVPKDGPLGKTKKVPYVCMKYQLPDWIRNKAADFYLQKAATQKESQNES